MKFISFTISGLILMVSLNSSLRADSVAQISAVISPAAVPTSTDPRVQQREEIRIKESQALNPTAPSPALVLAVQSPLPQPSGSPVREEMQEQPPHSQLDSLRTMRLKMEVLNEDKFLEDLELSRIQDEKKRLARRLESTKISTRNDANISTLP